MKILSDLLSVKSILSFIVIGTSSYGFVIGLIQAETYMVIVSAIITYYFTRKEKK